MLQGEHSAILSTFIKLPFVMKIFVLSIFEWPFYTGFTVYLNWSSWWIRIIVTLLSSKCLFIGTYYYLLQMEDDSYIMKWCYTHTDFIKSLLRSFELTLKAPIATKVVCFSCLLKCLRSIYDKQCGLRSDCSYRISLSWVHVVCFYT